jgi:hypothetical protein
MSSHWEWTEEVINKHAETCPFSPENGQPLRFHVGDHVIYTNDYGASFSYTVTGFYRPEPMTALYALGARYLVSSDSPWVPVRECQLRESDA